MHKMKSERRKKLKDDIRFAKNLVAESQAVMDHVVHMDDTPDDIKDKIRRIKNALDIDVEELERILEKARES
jgi:CBS-domain-containing membrane protein